MGLTTLLSGLAASRPTGNVPLADHRNEGDGARSSSHSTREGRAEQSGQTYYCRHRDNVEDKLAVEWYVLTAEPGTFVSLTSDSFALGWFLFHSMHSLCGIIGSSRNLLTLNLFLPAGATAWTQSLCTSLTDVS